MDLIEIKNLQVKRNNRIVLDVEHASVKRAETLALIGANGAGKTTLLLMLARLLQPSRGEILFNGEPIEKINLLEYRRRIALVLQEPLLMDMNVEQNIALGLNFRGVDKTTIKTKVNEWIARLGIEHLRKRHSAELSGGEAQRVSLARAFILNPDLLLLDEPFSALDAPTRTRLRAELKSILQETHTTTIFITHDLNEAAELGERTLMIENGKLQN